MAKQVNGSFIPGQHPAPLYESNLKSLRLLHRGKVRDIYAVGQDKLLIVQSDRLSAFDVVLPDPIPGKGEVLTDLSFFWFRQLVHIVPHHVLDIDPKSVVAKGERDQVRGRAMVVRKCRPLLVEAVVRGYIIGSGWNDYQKTGAVCGIKLPPGLQQAQQLPGPIFTPASKASAGQHDENIDFETMVRTLMDVFPTAPVKEARECAQRLAEEIRDVSIELYTEAAGYAAKRGIIIADTKFEFGIDDDGKLVLIDEVLTPDSSRFWPESEYRTRVSPPSFDKQFVRDWLEQQPWNKKVPAPHLPPEVIAQTSAKYWEALHWLTTKP